MLAFGSKVTSNLDAFIAKVQQISAQFGIVPDWLMAVMYFESNLNPAAVNASSGATGLIQFMPSTAADLGTSTAALKSMTNVQQLDYVYKYFVRSGKMPYVQSMTDLYLVVFYPAAVGKLDNFVIGAVGSAIAKQNPVFMDSTGAVTKGSVTSYFTRWLQSFGYNFDAKKKIMQQQAEALA